MTEPAQHASDPDESFDGIVRSLSERDRDIVFARALGYRLGEIAEVLELDVGTVTAIIVDLIRRAGPHVRPLVCGVGASRLLAGALPVSTSEEGAPPLHTSGLPAGWRSGYQPATASRFDLGIWRTAEFGGKMRGAIMLAICWWRWKICGK